MSSRNVIVVAFDDVAEDQIRTAIQSRAEVADVTVHVVAPAVHVGRLHWLTGDVDEARADAAELADRAAGAVDAEVETEVGDQDPILAVEDALRTFPADEILIAGTADADTETALRHLGLPVSRLDGSEVTAPEPGLSPHTREIVEGRAEETPVVMLGAVGAVMLTTVVVISLLVLVVFWLV